MKTRMLAKLWWHTPLTPALGRQWQADLCEFKVSLVFKTTSRTTRTQKPCLVGGGRLDGTLFNWVVGANAFNPSTWEAEAGGFL